MPAGARRWALPAAWALFILVCTSVPGAALPSAPSGVDKIVHVLLYAVLGLLLTRALDGGRRHRATWHAALIVIVSCALFAAVDEWHQDFIAGRSGDRVDWLADCVGACLGFMLATAMRTRREQPS